MQNHKWRPLGKQCVARNCIFSSFPIGRYFSYVELRLNYCAEMIQGLTARADARQCDIDKNTSPVPRVGIRRRHRFSTYPGGG
jgi:hypothetical protein